MAKITLYGVQGIPFTEKCRRALLLKGLDFELCEPTCPEDYRRWSPETGLLPVMTVDEERIADSTNILLRLDALFPEPPLLSSDPVVAAQQRQLEDWADESFLWYYLEWLRAAEAPAPLPGARGPLGRLAGRLRGRGRRSSARAEILRGIEGRLDDLVNFLGERPFFHSERVSMADLTVHAMLGAIERDQIVGGAELMRRRPALLAFMRRVEAATGG